MKSNNSLKRIFCFYVVLTIFIISFSAAICYSLYTYSKEIGAYKESISKDLNNFIKVFENYLWEMDYSNLATISNVIFNTNRNICNLTVKNELSKPIFSKKRSSYHCNSKNIIEYKKPIFYNNRHIGQVTILYSLHYIKVKLIKFILLNILFFLFIGLVVVFIIILLFDKYIEKNLSNIISNLEIMSSGNYKINFKQTGFEELDRIVNNLNLMLKEINLKDLKNEELTYRLEALIDSLPVALFIFNEKGKYIKINQTVCKMLKMEKDEILSKKIVEFSDNKLTKDYAYSILDKVLENEEYEFEWRLKTKDGKIIDTIAKGVKITLKNEIWLIFTLTDVTYLKNIEKELIRKEKLEAIALLAGGIAHDFNNILTSILGTIELIQIYIEKGKIKLIEPKLNSLLKASGRAKTLTNQLLTFSKGGAPIRKNFKNLPQLIKDTVEFLLLGSSIKVVYEFDENLKPVKIDPDQISLVIQNLIINAKEALNNKGTIKIKGVNSLDFVKISIKDYGQGIPENIINKIWEPYFTTKEKGNGLGLAIVYSIIKKHNGEIKVYSEEGKYTDFQIFLPVADSKNEIEKKPSNFNEKINSLKILALEDEDNIRELLYDFLKLMGHKPVVAKNGEEAVKLFKEESFDLAILDLTIKGGEGGEETIKTLKEINPDIKAIVCSGYSDSPVMKEYQKYGFNAVLKKPFTFNELKEVIEEIV